MQDTQRAPWWTKAGPWLASALALVALGIFVRDHVYSMYDDAFIYLRYLKSLRAGCGLRFNCQDAPVEGFSSPLYLGVLAAGSAFTTRFVALTQVLGTLITGALLVTSVLAAGVRAPDEPPPPPWLRLGCGAAVAAILALDHLVLLNAVTGMDTALAALMALLFWLAVRTERRAIATCMAIALLLARPEGILFAALLPILPWARDRRVVGAIVLGAGAITLARWMVFHEVVPNVIRAKSGGTLRHVELGASYLLHVVRDFPCIVLAPLLLWSPSPSTRAVARYTLLVTAAWALMLLFSGGDTFEYSRLAFPLIPILTIMAARGVVCAWQRSAPRAAVAGVTLSVLAWFGVNARDNRLLPAHGFDNVLRWTAVGRHLKANFPGQSIATVPIGAIGYYSELRVLDMVGLTSPEIAKAGRTVPPHLLAPKWIGHERHNLEWVLQSKPDLVITTKLRSEPWTRLEEASAGFYGEWLFLRAIKAGEAPYHVEDLAVRPDMHVLAFRRD